MADVSAHFTHDDYTVGWICALPETELVAAEAMLDERHSVLSAADPQDTNVYRLGRIGAHNVVIACLPASRTGKVSAATVAKDMLRSFKAVRFGLMVGIGGGAPFYGSHSYNEAEGSDSEFEDSSEDIRDIRLGDVVVSLESKSTEAVVQFDFGKSTQAKGFFHTGGKLNKPPNIVLSAVSMLQSKHKLEGHDITDHLSKVWEKYPRIAKEFERPGPSRDVLFKADVTHIDGKRTCRACRGISDTNIVTRNQRNEDEPYIHYGTIGSADQVMKDAILRDKWAKEEGIICFEMEAAGLMDSFPCLVIRGICDYSDSHKNKIWQPYAAATAAAYAKALLLVIPGQEIHHLPTIDPVQNKVLAQQEKWRRSDEEEKCLQAFRTTIYETQKNFNPERVNDTCLWCLNDTRFLNWRDHSTSCLLWVTADPGCGKSVLSKALVDEHLLDSTPNHATVSYFFFKDTSNEQRSPTSALAALLHQLFGSAAGKQTIKHALPAFRRDRENVARNFEVMWTIIEDIARDPDCGNIIFLLDALDECQSSERKFLITKLKSLEVLKNSARILRVFITSRPYWDIEKGFEDLISDIPGIRLRGENYSEALRSEIDKVITVRVSKLGHQIASKEIQAELLEKLLKVENRTYLWIHLVFNLIEQEPLLDMSTTRILLQSLPETLEQAFNTILQNSKDSLRVKKLLHIIVAAVRPLTVNEVGIALYITEDTHEHKSLQFQNTEQLGIAIRNLCGLFVSIIENKVFLIHQTAKEFLVAQDLVSFDTLTSSHNWKHSISMQEANLCLAQSCILYLHLKEPQKTRPPREEFEIARLVSKYGLLEYSAVNWAIHVVAAMIPDNHALMGPVSQLCNVQRGEFMSWVSIFWKARVGSMAPRNMQALHVAARLGLTGAVKSFLETSDINVNTADENGLTPLHHAADSGHDDVVAHLLAAPDIDVNVTDDYGWTALHYVCRWGYSVLAERLLAVPGTDANVPDYRDSTALHYACDGGYETIVKLLLATSGIIMDAVDDRDWTPLHSALNGGHEAVVCQLLATPGIDANAGQTALHLACKNGYEAVVCQLLATPGIGVNAVNHAGQTALHLACESGHEAVVCQLLATSGIDVNAVNHDRERALHLACKHGHEAVVHQLLATPDIDVNVVDYRDRTALHFACESGHEAIVHQLLATPGIDINAVDYRDRTALHFAYAGNKQHGAIVHHLLAIPGVKVNAVDDEGFTPLQYAYIKRPTIPENLLLGTFGFDRIGPDSDGSTPLQLSRPGGIKTQDFLQGGVKDEISSTISQILNNTMGRQFDS